MFGDERVWSLMFWTILYDSTVLSSQTPEVM